MKKLACFVLLLVLLLNTPIFAAPVNYVYDYETITVGTSAVGLTASKINKLSPTASTKGAIKTLVIISVEGANIRYRIDGIAPTSTVGDLVYAGDRITFDDYYDAYNFKAIRDSAAATDATLQVQYKAVK